MYWFLFNVRCHEMHQSNVQKSMACEAMDNKAVAMQSSVDSLNADIKKLSSE